MGLMIEMQNIAGFRDKTKFNLREGLNVVESPNAGGKTSFIRGLRAMILPADLLKDKRHFLNMTTKSGSVRLKLNDVDYSRDLRDVNGKLSVTGKPITSEGAKADTMCVAIRENLLIRLIESEGSVRPVLDEFSGAKYYRVGATILKRKIKGVNGEISKRREEYQNLQDHQKELARLRKEMEKLLKEKGRLPEIPEADTEVMKTNQELVKQKTMELSKARVELDNKNKETRERQKGIAGKEKEIEGYEKRIREFKERHPDVDAEIAELEGMIRELTEQRNELYAHISGVSGELETTRKAQRETSKSKANYCPACGRKMTPELLRSWERKLQKKYEGLTEEMSSVNAQVQERTEEWDSLREEVMRVKLGKTGDMKMLSDSQRRLKDLNREVRNLTEGKEKLEGTIAELEKEIKDLERSIDPSIIALTQKHGTIETRLGILQNDLDRTSKAIEDIGQAGEDIRALDKQKRLLTSVTTLMQKESERLLMEVVNDFNSRIGHIYDLLEFEDFEKIYIDDYTFEINVVRRKGSQTIRQPIKSLAGSERGTLGLILMLAGKEKYIPDFPMFILDAVSEDYDETRLSRIVRYLEERVPYVIVTTLTPHKDSDDIVIRHKL